MFQKQQHSGHKICWQSPDQGDANTLR